MNILFILMLGFFVFIFGGPGFAEEAESAQVDTSIVEESPDEKVKVIPASYQAVELVRELGRGIFRQSAQSVFSPDGKIIYCSDQAAYQVLAYDREGNLLFRFGGQKLGLILNPGLSGEEIAEQTKAYEESMVGRIGALMNIAVDKAGNVYVADYSENNVKMYTPEGKFVLDIPMQVNLQKKSPGKGVSGVAINSRGDIYITDSANGRVQINDLNGKYKYQIIKYRNKDGKELPIGMVGHPGVNSLDELYVIEPLSCRVHRFNADGDYLGGFGYMGEGAGGFNAPVGLAIDKLDRVYVADIGSNVVQVFSKEGGFLYALCDPKGKRLEIPFVNGVGVDRDGLIYIATCHRGYLVKVFKYLTETPKMGGKGQ